MEKTKIKHARKASLRVYVAAICALLGVMSKGYVFGWSSPAFDDMEREDSEPHLGMTYEDKHIKSWIGSSITLGALGGSLLCGVTIHYLGRKKALILYGVPLTIGWGLIAAAKSVSMIIAGRVLTGFCCGLLSGSCPTYLIELSTPKVRGMLGASFQVFVTLGILVTYVFGIFLHWNYLAAFCVIPGVLMSVLMFFMPESPVWLMNKYGRDSRVESALRMIRKPDSDIENELKELEDRTYNSKKAFSLTQLRHSEYYKPILISVFLMVFQQLSGFIAVTLYVTEIFKDSHSSIKPNVAEIFVGAAMLFATMLSSSLNDKLGRKALLLISGVGHAISLGVMGYYYYMHQTMFDAIDLADTLSDEDSDVISPLVTTMASNATVDSTVLFDTQYGWVPIVCLVVFVASYSIGFGPIGWMMFAELTPSSAITFTSSLVTSVHWTCAFIITKHFELLQRLIKRYGAYWLMAAISVVSIAFVLLFVPETKGKSATEIRHMFVKNRGEKPREEDNGVIVVMH